MKRIPFLVFRVLTLLSAVLVPVLVCLLMGYLLWRGLPSLGPELLFGHTKPLDAVLGRAPVWDGLWPACVGTFYLVLLTMALAVFPGVGCGMYLAEAATEKQKRVIGSAVDMLAGMPSIVMGLFGFMLILFLRRTFLPGANISLLLAAGCLALLVLPVLTASTREAMAAVPASLRLAAAASGLSRTQAMFHLCLPAAAKGILGGVVLAVGRAAEDTAVILFTGVVANAGMPAGLFGKFEALSFDIYYISSQYQDQEELLRGFGAAALLLCVSCLLLLAARALEHSFRKTWQGRA
ncbi:PstA family ABC transporter permease [Mailhella massiliensis]|uniref:ABC transporter permease subunit n=1 Tax=Mailhella massiliensis TaxID=1903261 RepID=A0A921DQF2_9BACT|nr:ABC transporter permease subunit [Mailhella massiliensis]HJD96409.1 ABC transporter permease subunit [Mailhella massiliensis]